jgi:hypothetical protein
MNERVSLVSWVNRQGVSCSPAICIAVNVSVIYLKGSLLLLSCLFGKRCLSCIISIEQAFERRGCAQSVALVVCYVEAYAALKSLLYRALLWQSAYRPSLPSTEVTRYSVVTPLTPWLKSTGIGDVQQMPAGGEGRGGKRGKGREGREGKREKGKRRTCRAPAHTLGLL